MGKKLVLGYGHKSRILYGLWTVLLISLLLLRHFVFKTDEIPAALVIWGIVWLGGLAVLYILLTVAERFFETPWFRRSLEHGQGGSARWGGSGAFAKYEWSQIKSGSAPIYLGRTLDKFDPRLGGRDIGINDKSHLVTIAQSGSGKSTTVIWPNLVKYPYPDSVFVLDPKGEHARNTSKHRAAQGQRVIVLAPFSLPATEGLQTHGFNPLAHIDVNSDRATEDINAIADACVIPSTKSDSTTQHFERLQRAMISGIIAHTLTTEPTSHHNLPFVYERLMDLGTDEHFVKFLEQMRANRSCGDLPRRAVTLYERAGKNEKGSIFTTTIGNIEWVASTGMRKLLLGNDFQISQLRTELMSLYVVLDFEAMKPDAQGRFMRVLMNLAFTTCRMIPLPAERAHRRTLFILDEVAQVGTMPSLQSAYQTLRSYHVKIWSFYQQWSSLSNQVQDTEAITGNSTKQFFGCGDMTTAEQIEKFLDKYRHHDGVRELQRQLLSAGEVYDFLGQEDMVQIVITGQGDKMQLTREFFIPPSKVPPKKSHFFQHVENFIQHAKLKSRMRPEKAKINETEELLQVVQDDLWACIKARDYGGEADRIRVKYERTLQPGYVMEQFKRVVENPDVKAILNEFPEAMKPGNFCLHHAGDINRIFDRAACLLPLAEIMDMADYIASNDVLRLSASIDYGFCYARDDVFHGMGELLKRCPIENKLELYAKLETSGYLEDRMPKQSASKVVYFVADAFEGIETETAVSVLRSSKAWRSVKKDKLLCDWIIDRDKRLLPALEDVEESSQAEEAPQEEPEKKPEPEAEPEESGEYIRSQRQQDDVPEPENSDDDASARQADNYRSYLEACMMFEVVPYKFKEEQVKDRDKYQALLRKFAQQKVERNFHILMNELDARQAESRYTPEQDAARLRFYLPEGFTCAQLQERYVDLADKVPSNQLNQVNADHEVLLACCCA